MGSKKTSTTPLSQGSMKQKSISSFFAAKPKSKAASPNKANGKAGTTAAAAAATDSNKENCATAAASPGTHTPSGTPAAAAAAAPAPQQLASTAAAPPAAKSPQAATAPSSDAQAARPAAGSKAAAAAGAECGAALVGRDVKVYWPKDKAWYKGNITDFNEQDGKHHVTYDDGDDEWLLLSRETYKVLPAGGARSAAARKRRRRVVVDSDDDDEGGAADDDAGDDDEPDDSGADSDFQAGDECVDDDEDDVMELEDEAAAAADEAAAAADELCDEGVMPASTGNKRKRANSKSARKRPAGSSQAAATPASASAAAGAAAGGKPGSSRPQQPPSSAGHTPMERFGCVSSVTPAPQLLFPSLTPPSGSKGAAGGGAAAAAAAAGDEAPTPDLSAFKKQRPSSAGTAADGGVTPGGSSVRRGGVTPGGVSSAAGGSVTPCSVTPVTPDSAAKAALQGKLDLTPTAGGAKTEPRMVLGVVASGGSEAARFAARMAERFSFLQPDKIRDKAGKRPDDPQYNPRTLRVPDNWFKQHKVTEAQQQWWRFKTDNFDSVLLFKVGKFYEMFEMDAFVGVDVLGLSFMKGDQPHAGFPEAAYHTMAEQLARAGYRVVVVEQTETPDQLKARNAARPSGTKMVNVVAREAVAVLSRGTLIDPEMVAAHPDAAYVLAVVECCGGAGGHDAPFIGVCALDTAAGQVLIGAWRDDEVRLQLRTQLTGLRPVEVVLPRRGSGVMSEVTSRLVRCGASRGPQPALNELPASAADVDDALKALSKYFPDPDNLPPLLQQLKQQYSGSSSSSTGGSSDADVDMTAGDVGDAAAADGTTAAAGVDGVGVSGVCGGREGRWLSGAALGAFGLMVSFLSSNMLDKALLPHAKYEALCEGVSGSDEPVCMELNGAALEGLEVLENALGGTQGSLLGLLDHCSTPFGRRRLRRWLTRPLFRIADITRRQDAVEELMGSLDAAVGAARRALAGCSDLERCLARLAASVGGGAAAAGGDGGGGGGFGRDASHVVLYEDVARRRVRVLVGAMKDLRALQAALEAMQEGCPSSELLCALTESSRWSDFGVKLQELSAAAEWGRAEADGVVRPSKKGVDAAYDEAQAAVEAAEGELQAYLVRVRKQLDCRSVVYTSLNKESHVLEVPESSAGRMPSSYSLVGHRKGFKRYTTSDLAGLVADLAAAQEERERVEAGVLRNLERLFVSHQELWTSAIEAVGVLDCLMALAGAALAADGTMCRPVLLPHPTGPDGTPSGGVFRAQQLRHPAGIAGAACGSFVPNDISLGGGDDGGAPGFILLTGPNMGGKSTLLRQVCLAAVLAQVGALVPAERLELTPMDGCFVRMGARDAILSGQSTFYIEMAETAAMLVRASPRSLVALDELGRGTATLDGAAIAAAVLDHLAHTSHCCGLFATHYHQLAAEHATDPQVAIMHMACAVAEQQQQPAAGKGDTQQQSDGGAVASSSGGGSNDEVAEVTFLYKLTHGACPKSYGTNVARLAGLPASVVTRAGVMSTSREAVYAAGAAQQQQQRTPQATAAAADGGGGGGAAAAEAMDVDDGVVAAVELQQVVCGIKEVLQQLEGVQGGIYGEQQQQQAGQLQEQLVQLQQRAAVLCQ